PRMSSPPSTSSPIPRKASMSRHTATRKHHPRVVRRARTSTTFSRARKAVRIGIACSTPSKSGITTPVLLYGSHSPGMMADLSATYCSALTCATAKDHRPSWSEDNGSMPSHWATGRSSAALSRLALISRTLRWQSRDGSQAMPGSKS
ncbi:hypothetical protein E4U42_000231, partial [Claviceps africana]